MLDRTSLGPHCPVSCPGSLQPAGGDSVNPGPGCSEDITLFELQSPHTGTVCL